MKEFFIPPRGKDPNSVSHTIRWQSKVYDALMELSYKHNVSFNRLVNACVEYALNNMAEPNGTADEPNAKPGKTQKDNKNA